MLVAAAAWLVLTAAALYGRAVAVSARQWHDCARWAGGALIVAVGGTVAAVAFADWVAAAGWVVAVLLSARIATVMLNRYEKTERSQSIGR